VRRRVLALVLPLTALVVVAGTAVSMGWGTAGPDRPGSSAANGAARPVVRTVEAPDLVHRGRALSRSATRVTASRVTLQALPKVHGHKHLTAPLNLWPTPEQKGRPLTVLPSGSAVAVTGAHRAGLAQIVRNGRVRWVNADYLVDHLPRPVAAQDPDPAATGSSESSGGPLLSRAPCPSGSGMESGIVPAAVALHRAVCAHFPQVHEYGGYRSDGEHADGHAIDIMVYSDSGTGQAVADWVRAHAAALHVDDVIWAQHIWTTQRASEGWRLMPDRGSTTANHYDHVHVRVF
jgi:hypothetical protein